MKYYAFISYKREDEWWAKWLQRKLEHYKLPSDFNGRSDLPKEIRPIFRDQSELAGGVLADEINKALQQSNYLIVICSPRAAQSEWVSKEVQTFIDLGRDAAVVKVVAQMFHMTFGDLWHRFEREKIRNRTLTFAALVFILIITAAIAFTMWSQNQEIKEKDHKMLENRSRLIAEKAQLMVNQGDPYSAHQLLLAVLPDSLGDPNPYTPEAGDALVYAIRNNNICINKHNDEVSSAFYSPDGSRVLSASDDMTARVWYMDDCDTLAVPMKEIIKRCRDYYPKLTKEERIYYRID